MGQPNQNDCEADFFLAEKCFLLIFFEALSIYLVLTSYVFPILEKQSVPPELRTQKIFYMSFLPGVATGVAIQVPTCYPHFLYF